MSEDTQTQNPPAPEQNPPPVAQPNTGGETKATPQAQGGVPAKPELPKNGKRILIVEDERPLAHALELKFTHEGYATEIASNGAEGLQKAEAGDFSLILLDLIMPELDGFAFMEQLKKKVPIIVLSNLGQEEDKTRALGMGAAGYFVKSNTPITEIINKAKESMK